MGYLPSSAFAAMPELFAFMPRIFLQVYVLSFLNGACSHGSFSKFTNDMKSWAQTSPPWVRMGRTMDLKSFSDNWRLHIFLEASVLLRNTRLSAPSQL